MEAVRRVVTSPKLAKMIIADPSHVVMPAVPVKTAIVLLPNKLRSAEMMEAVASPKLAKMIVADPSHVVMPAVPVKTAIVLLPNKLRSAETMDAVASPKLAKMIVADPSRAVMPATPVTIALRNRDSSHLLEIIVRHGCSFSNPSVAIVRPRLHRLEGFARRDLVSAGRRVC